MSQKGKKGSLSSVSSINRFSDVGLGLESGSGLMEMEHDFHDRDGHAREGSTAKTGGLSVYVNDDGAEDVHEGTSDRNDIVNDSGMGSGTKGITLTKGLEELS
ncbi:hypothetical protein HN51_063657 [Arachis hypogaea]